MTFLRPSTVLAFPPGNVNPDANDHANVGANYDEDGIDNNNGRNADDPESTGRYPQQRFHIDPLLRATSEVALHLRPQSTTTTGGKQLEPQVNLMVPASYDPPSGPAAVAGFMMDEKVYLGRGPDEKYGREVVEGRGSIDYAALPQTTSGSFSSHGGSFSSVLAGGNVYSPSTISPGAVPVYTNVPTTTPGPGSGSILTTAASYPISSSSSNSAASNNTSRPTSQHGPLSQSMSAGVVGHSPFATQQQQLLRAQQQGQGRPGMRMMMSSGGGVVGGSRNGINGMMEDMPSSALPPISQDFARPSETRRPATSAGIMQSGGGGPVQQSGRFPFSSVNGGAGAVMSGGGGGMTLTMMPNGTEGFGRNDRSSYETMDRRRRSMQSSSRSGTGLMTYPNGMEMRDAGLDGSASQSVRPTDLRLNSAGNPIGTSGGYAPPPAFGGGTVLAHGRRGSDYSDLFAHSIDQVSPYPPGAVMSHDLSGNLEQDLRRASASAAGTQQHFAFRPGSSGSAMSTLGTGRAPGSSHSVRFQTNPHPSSSYNNQPVSPTTAVDNGALNSLVTAVGMVGPSSAEQLALRRASEPHFKHPFQQVNLPSQARLYHSLGTDGQDGNPQMQRQFAGFQMSPMQPAPSVGGYGGYTPDRRESVASRSGVYTGVSAGADGESRRPSLANSTGYPPSAGLQYASFPPDYRFGQNSPHSAGPVGPSPVGSTFNNGQPSAWSQSVGPSYYPQQSYPAGRSDSVGGYDPNSYSSQHRSSESSAVDRRSSMGQSSHHPDARRESGTTSMHDDAESSNGGGGGQIDPSSGQVHKKRPRRKFDQIERLYLCGFEGCEKSYGTLNHLNAHVYMQKHGVKRRPEEFKEIRRAWKKQKKEDAGRTPSSTRGGPAGLAPMATLPPARSNPSQQQHQPHHHHQPQQDQLAHESIGHWGQQQW